MPLCLIKIRRFQRNRSLHSFQILKIKGVGSEIDDKLIGQSEFTQNLKICIAIRIIGSGALYGKMLLVRIIESNKIDVYFRSG